ncbi:MAG: 7TM domain-containing protein, partial [Gammaproteobacteria bacterium]|nr:7TM domain-containing protein [Gammaproteobacteria bacterium]
RVLFVRAPTPGRYTIHSVFQLHEAAAGHAGWKRPRSTDALQRRFLEQTETLPTTHPSVTALVSEIVAGANGNTETAERIVDWVREGIARGDINAPGKVEDVIGNGRGNPVGRVRTLVTLARAAGLPARVVSGVALEETSGAPPRTWAEVHLPDGWHTVDVERGHLGELPRHLLPIRRNGERVESVEAGRGITRIEISRERAPAAFGAGGPRPMQDIIDLTRLSLEARRTMGLLLLLPLGALVTVVVRRAGGIRTYGTFTPTLLALAATLVDLEIGLAMAAAVVVVGLLGRAMLAGEPLTRAPRLAVVFTVIAIAMAMGVSALAHFEFDTSTVVALIPLVVMTNLVDRVYAVADESGVRAALLRLWWTLVTAAVIAPMLMQEEWGQFLLRFPELHFLTLSAILVIGGWRGPTLASRPAFRWMNEPAVRTASEEPG